LVIPENIALVFLPPYSPELNPAENIWEKFKQTLTNKFFSNLEDVEGFISEMVVSTTKKEVINICGYRYIFLMKSGLYYNCVWYKNCEFNNGDFLFFILMKYSIDGL
jgi:transposase